MLGQPHTSIQSKLVCKLAYRCVARYARNIVTCVSTTLVDAAHPYVVCMYNIRVAHAQHTHTHVDTRVSTIRRHTRHYVPGVLTYVDTHVSTIVDDVRSVSDVVSQELFRESAQLRCAGMREICRELSTLDRSRQLTEGKKPRSVESR